MTKNELTDKYLGNYGINGIGRMEVGVTVYFDPALPDGIEAQIIEDAKPLPVIFIQSNKAILL